MARKPNSPDCSACKAFPDHNPRKGTCSLGHPFEIFRKQLFPRRANGICHHKCFTKAQLTSYMIEVSKDPDYIPRKPRNLRGIIK